MRGAQDVRKGQEGPGVPWVDADTPVQPSVGPWQYQSAARYPVYHPPGTHPVYPSPVPTLARTPTVTAMHEYTGPRAP